VAFYRPHCKAVRSLLHRQPVSFTSYLLQTDCESSYDKIALKPDIRRHFTYLKAITFNILSPNKTSCNNNSILTRKGRFLSLIHSTDLSINPQHCWHKLLKFNEVPRSVKTNFSTVLFKQSVTFTNISSTWLRPDSLPVFPDRQYIVKVQQYDQNLLWILLQILLLFLSRQSLSTTNIRPSFFWNVT